jgi:hypothetical protein
VNQVQNVQYTLFGTRLGEISPKGKEYTCNFAVLAINKSTGRFKFLANEWTPKFWLDYQKTDRYFMIDPKNDALFADKICVERDVESVPDGLWWHDYMTEHKEEQQFLCGTADVEK